MRKLKIGVVDLVSKHPTRALYARVMHANLASIMPQAIGVWCEELGHRVRFVCYTGFEDLTSELVDDTDVLIVGAFTRSALTAYAISNLYRGRGAITIQTAQEGDIFGWSWLFPPYQWLFDARALMLTRAVHFDGACLRTKCDANPAMGYDLMKRFARVFAKRIEATRLQLLDIYGTTAST